MSRYEIFTSRKMTKISVTALNRRFIKSKFCREDTATYLVLIDVSKQLVHSVRTLIQLFHHGRCITKSRILLVGIAYLLQALSIKKTSISCR